MATKNIFAAMLNQKPIAAPQVKPLPGAEPAQQVPLMKPPHAKQFANTSGNMFHPMGSFDKDVAPVMNVWGRIKQKGLKNV